MWVWASAQHFEQYPPDPAQQPKGCKGHAAACKAQGAEGFQGDACIAYQPPGQHGPQQADVGALLPPEGSIGLKVVPTPSNYHGGQFSQLHC